MKTSSSEAGPSEGRDPGVFLHGRPEGVGFGPGREGGADLVPVGMDRNDAGDEAGGLAGPEDGGADDFADPLPDKLLRPGRRLHGRDPPPGHEGHAAAVLGFVQVGRGNDDGHPPAERPARMFQKSRRATGSTPLVGSSRWISARE